MLGEIRFDAPEGEEKIDSVVDELKRPVVLEGCTELSVALAGAVLLLALGEFWNEELGRSDVDTDELLTVVVPPLVALANAEPVALELLTVVIPLLVALADSEKVTSLSSPI